MAYRIRKAPKRELYWVIAQDGKHMSKEPLPLERAKAQMRALYASENEQKKGGQLSDEQIAKYAPTLTSLAAKEFVAGPAPSNEAYDRYVKGIQKNNARLDAIKSTMPRIAIPTYDEWAAQQTKREAERRIGVEQANVQGAKEIPSLVKGWESLEADPLVMCPYSLDGELKKTSMRQSQCGEAKAAWEKKHHPENYYFFRPAVEALSKAGDVAVENLPIGVMGDVYKTFAPPTSKFYGQGDAVHYVRKRGRGRRGLHGEGFFSDLWATTKRVANKVVERARAVFKGPRNDYPPNVRQVIQQIGNDPIISMYVRRDPIKGMLSGALNLLTLGKWDEMRKKYNYDKVFHLGLEIAVKVNPSSNQVARYVVEKNEVINIGPAKSATPDTEFYPVPMNGSITLNTLLAGGQRVLGPRYFTYDAFQSNCQDFVLALLSGSGLATPELTAIVKQPLEQVLEGLPSYTRGIAKGVTDFAAIANVALHGQGKLKSKLAKYKVSPNDYLSAVQSIARRNGYSPESLQFSDRPTKKFSLTTPEGRKVHFGAAGADDYVLLALSGKSALADKKRAAYLARATKIKGDWAKDPYSPNSLATRILWPQKGL